MRMRHVALAFAAVLLAGPRECRDELSVPAEEAERAPVQRMLRRSTSPVTRLNYRSMPVAVSVAVAREGRPGICGGMRTKRTPARSGPRRCREYEQISRGVTTILRVDQDGRPCP